MKNCTPPETAIIYAVKKQIVETISTAGKTLFSWNRTNIFHWYKVENNLCKMKSYPEFPFSHIILFDFPLIASQLNSFSRHVWSFVADQKVENMCLEDQLLRCKYCQLYYPDDWKHKSEYIQVIKNLLIPSTEAKCQDDLPHRWILWWQGSMEECARASSPPWEAFLTKSLCSLATVLTLSNRISRR